MKKIGFLAIGVIASLMLTSVFADTTDTETTPASVTVNAYVSTTIAKCGNTDFGSQDPGDTDEPVACQSTGNDTTPAVTITVESETNVNVDIALKGDDFSRTGGGGTITVGNVEYDDDHDKTDTDTGNNAVGTLITSYVDYWADTGTGDYDLWFWLDIPASQTAGDYTSTFYFETSEHV